MTPARKFMAPNGKTSTQPLRPLPEHSDEHEFAGEREADRVADRTRLCDEPEFPTGAWCDAQADLGRTYDRLRHAADVQAREQIREQLMHDLGPLIALEHRMTEARRRAKQQHVNVSHELHVCRLMLERARTGNRTNPTSLVSRVERLEARLDHRPDLDQAA